MMRNDTPPNKARVLLDQAVAEGRGMRVVDGESLLLLVTATKQGNGKVELDCMANGLSREEAATLMRRLADRWETGQGQDT
jgi:hypothetical protein